MSEQSISSRNLNGYGTQKIIGVDWSRKLDRKSAAPLSNPNLKSLVVFSRPEYKQNFNNAYNSSYRSSKEKKSFFGASHSSAKAKNTKSRKLNPIGYRLFYGTAFLGIFGVLFFFTVRLSFAANIETEEEKIIKSLVDDIYEYEEKIL